MDKYASSYGVADKATRLLRRGLGFFPWTHIQPLIPRLLARMMTCFEASGHSSYIWLVDRTVALFGERMAVLAGSPEGAVLETAFTSALERMTTQVKSLEVQQDATQIPDGELDGLRQCHGCRTNHAVDTSQHWTTIFMSFGPTSSDFPPYCCLHLRYRSPLTSLSYRSPYPRLTLS